MTHAYLFRKLKAQARRRAELRGHTMTRFQSHGIPADELTAVTAHCTQCGAEVTVTPHPVVDESYIGGPAVATDCKGSR